MESDCRRQRRPRGATDAGNGSTDEGEERPLLLDGGIDWNRGGTLLGDSWQFQDQSQGLRLARRLEVRHHLGGSQAGKASDILAGAVEEIPVFEKVVEESFDE